MEVEENFQGLQTHLRTHAHGARAAGGAPDEAAARRELAAHQHDRRRSATGADWRSWRC